MDINTLRGMKMAAALPIGTHQVVFKKFQWRIDKDGQVKGAWIHIDGFKPLYLNYFDNNENYQLEYLLNQLGTDSYDDNIINEFTNTVITVTRYPKEEYINTSFNPNPKAAE